eukprot:388299-Rhodomonas_salina.1
MWKECGRRNVEGGIWKDECGRRMEGAGPALASGELRGRGAAPQTPPAADPSRSARTTIHKPQQRNPHQRSPPGQHNTQHRSTSPAA